MENYSVITGKNKCRNLVVSHEMANIVVPKIADFTESRIIYYDAVHMAGSYSDNSISVELRSLARTSERARPFSIIHIANFFQKMPKIEKVRSLSANNSTRTASVNRKSLSRLTKSDLIKIAVDQHGTIKKLNVKLELLEIQRDNYSGSSNCFRRCLGLMNESTATLSKVIASVFNVTGSDHGSN